MQKKLLVLAIAAIASGAALADDNVTIYGRIDYGFVSRSGDSGQVITDGTKSEFASGVAAGSRIGFRGTEDLGNGLKALFEAEFGIAVDNGPLSGSATWGNRHSYIGLTGGFGTVVGGRVDGARYGFATKYDPFGSGTVANMTNLQTHATRADNAIAYISPNWNGFSFLAAYTTSLIGNEAGHNALPGSPAGTLVKGNTGDLRLWALAPQYNNGPISVTYDHEEADPKDVSNAKVKIDVLAGSYDFQVVKVAAYWEKVRNDPKSWDQQSWFVGATVPFAGKAAFKVGYMRLDDRTSGETFSGDCHKVGVGLQYNLSKRTNIYTDYGRVSNDASGTCTIGYAGTNGSLDAPDASGLHGGYGTHGFDLGIAHTF